MFRVPIQASRTTYTMIVQRPKMHNIHIMRYRSTKQKLKHNKLKHEKSSMLSRTIHPKSKSYTNQNEKKHSHIAYNESKTNNESMIHKILENISKQTNIHHIPQKGKAIMKRLILFMGGCMIFPIYFVSPEGPSMSPTLAPRDEILVIDRYFYLIWELVFSIVDDTKIHSINVGDIVLVSKPNNKQSKKLDEESHIFPDDRERVIKRVIAIGNQLEDETNDTIMQNQTNDIPLLSLGSIWIEGDNLILSSDSRDCKF